MVERMSEMNISTGMHVHDKTRRYSSTREKQTILLQYKQYSNTAGPRNASQGSASAHNASMGSASAQCSDACRSIWVHVGG